MKPLINPCIQKLVQTKWDVVVHGRDLYLVKPTLGPPKKFQHLTRAEEVIITRLRIGHTKATKSHILSRGPPTCCHHCGQTLTIDHMLLECALLQECRDEYYTVDSLNALFETILETFIVEFLREAGFFYLIWCILLTSTTPPDVDNMIRLEKLFREWKQLWDIFTYVGRLICPEGHVSSFNKSNPTNPTHIFVKRCIVCSVKNNTEMQPWVLELRRKVWPIVLRKGSNIWIMKFKEQWFFISYAKRVYVFICNMWRQ